MIWIILTLLAQCRAETQIEPVPESAPMLFSKLARANIAYENYAMIYYVDLAEYYRLHDLINTAVNLANETCSEIEKIDMCPITVEQLYNQLMQAERDDENMGVTRGVRSFCDWCGAVQNRVYGTLDKEKGERIVKRVNEVGNETAILHDEMLNQTTIFQAFLKINKGNMEKIEHGISDIAAYLNETRTQMLHGDKIIHIRSKTQTLVQIASMALNEHFRLYSQIRRALADAKNHRVPELISADALKRDLKGIAASLKKTQRLPIDSLQDNPLKVFEYAEITTMLMEDKLLIEIMIPIAETEQYNLYKATPIPIQTENGRLIVQTTTSHFLMNADQTKFIELTRRELNHGKMLSANEILYRPSTTTHLKHENNCVWKMLIENSMESSLKICTFLPFPQNDVLITIIENEKYYMASNNGMTLWEICDRSENQRKIIGSNIVTLDPSCYLKTTDFIIKPHRTHMYNQTQLITLQLTSTSISIAHLKNLAHESFSNYNFKNMKPIVIHDSTQMQQVIEDTANLVVRANHKFNMEQLSLKSSSLFDKLSFDIKFSSWLMTALSTGGTLTVVGGIAFFVVTKMKIFSTILESFGFSPKLTNQGGVVVNLSEVSTNQHGRPNTPYPKHRERDMHELPSEPTHSDEIENDGSLQQQQV